MALATKPFSNRIAVVFDFDDTLVPDTVDSLLAMGIDALKFRQEQMKPLNQEQGTAIALYKNQTPKQWERQLNLTQGQRVANLTPVDYSENSELMQSLTLAVESICKQICLRQLSDLMYLVGIGSHWPNEDKPAVALAEVPELAPRFVMMHHPESFTLFPANTAPVAVAGHTHGGQIRLPFTPKWSWLTFTKEDRVHVDGWIDGYGQQSNHLYVNRGIGFSILPIRINCPPEITLFTLRQARSST